MGLPDICLVPATPSPIPMVFVNIAMCVDAVGTAESVRLSGAEAIVESSIIPFSTGDEPGRLGGVMSSTFRGLAKFKTSSSKVKARGKRVILQGALVGQNGSPANVPCGQQVDASQTKVIVRR